MLTTYFLPSSTQFSLHGSDLRKQMHWESSYQGFVNTISVLSSPGDGILFSTELVALAENKELEEVVGLFSLPRCCLSKNYEGRIKKLMIKQHQSVSNTQ